MLAAVNFVDVTALFDISYGAANQGVAGDLDIKLSLGTGDLSSGLNGVSPNVNFTGSFQLIFNTTETQIVYTIPSQFLSLLSPTQPTTITIPDSPPPAPLFTLNEANSAFPDAINLPQTIAAAVSVSTIANWQTTWQQFFAQDGNVTLSTNAMVQLASVDNLGNPYSWTVTDGANVYTITRQYADPDNSDTTNELVVEQTSNTPAAYIQLQIQGNLDLFNEINLAGMFVITASVATSSGYVTTTLNIQGNVTANVPILGTLSGGINFTAQISTDPTMATGFWGGASLTLNVNGIPGVTFSRQVFLLVNASNMTQNLTVYGPDNTVLATVPDFGAGFEFEITGYLDVGSLLDFNGTFLISLQLTGPNPGLIVAADATLMIGPFGGLSVNGVLAINSQGLVTELSITLGNGNTFGSGVGLNFNAMATLDLNTTGTAQSYTVGSQTITVQPGFLLSISGSISFVGLATATGSAMISITSQQFAISFNLTINFRRRSPDQCERFRRSLLRRQPRAALELNTSIDATVAQIINIDASGTLLLNTTSVTRTANGFTLGPNSFDLSLNGSVSFLSVLSFNASFMIVVGGDQQVTFNPVLGPGDSLPNGQTSETETLGPDDWYVSFKANINFFGLASLSAYGMFDYKGQFAVGLSGGLVLGSSDFGISGSFSINACLLYVTGDPYFDLNGSGSVSAGFLESASRASRSASTLSSKAPRAAPTSRSPCRCRSTSCSSRSRPRPISISASCNSPLRSTWRAMGRPIPRYGTGRSTAALST